MGKEEVEGLHLNIIYGFLRLQKENEESRIGSAAFRR